MGKVPYPELRAELARNGDMQKDIAALLSIGESTFCRKLRGLSDWKLSEIQILCNHYGKPFTTLFSTVAK